MTIVLVQSYQQPRRKCHGKGLIIRMKESNMRIRRKYVVDSYYLLLFYIVIVIFTIIMTITISTTNTMIITTTMAYSNSITTIQRPFTTITMNNNDIMKRQQNVYTTTPIRSNRPFLMSLSRYQLHQQQQQQHKHDISIMIRKANPNDDNNDSNDSITTTKKKSAAGISSWFNIYDSQIPDDIRQDIYDIESKTPNAQNRTSRITMYTLIAITCLLMAFGNVTLSELKSDALETTATNSIDMDLSEYDWLLNAGPIASFIFFNKIGGFILLATAGVTGLLAESELDNKRLNSERIYEELMKRRNDKKKIGGTKTITNSNSNVKKRRSNKEMKRMNALSEVISSSTTSKDPVSDVVDKPKTTIETNDEATKNTSTTQQEENSNNTIIRSMQNFYQKADSMAASQALLLNKKLEDVGIIDKITDESGLRIIGKEQAAKAKQLQQQNQLQSQDQPDQHHNIVEEEIDVAKTSTPSTTTTETIISTAETTITSTNPLNTK